MNRFYAMLCILLVCCFAFTACGDREETKDEKSKNKTSSVAVDSSLASESSKTPVILIDKTTRVVECLKEVMEAETAEDIKGRIVNPTEQEAESLAEYYPDKQYTVTAEKVGTFEEYDLFSYTAKGSDGHTETNMALVLFDGTYCRLCVDDAVAARFQAERKCSLCGGAGTTQTSGTPCGICGGTGQQYIDNAYFDAALQSWQGQWQACGGCGGAGTIGGVSTPCGGCDGRGFLAN